MKNWLYKRSKEKSTYAGLAAFIFGLGTILKSDHTDAISGAIAKSGDSLAAGDYTTGAVIIGTSLVAIFSKTYDQK